MKKGIITAIVLIIIIAVIYLFFKRKKENEIYMNEIISIKDLKFSDKGKNYLKSKENLSLDPYWDVKGWSIGYGHFMGSVKPGRITKETAENYFIQDIEKAEKFVKSKIKKPISQGLYDVLVMLAFNMGSFQPGLIGLINNGAPINQIIERIKLYHQTETDDKSIEARLLARRIDEIKNFIT